MKYFVSVGSDTIEVEIDGDGVTVDRVGVRIELGAVADSPELAVVVDGASHRLALEGAREGVWRLVDRGTVYEVGVEDERRRHIRLLAGGAKVESGDTILKAPMPGLVVRILVKPGDLVAAGESLIALEAMKMENELKATAPGVVEAVRVEAGQAVEKGQVLITLSAPAELTKTVAGG